MNVEDRSPQGHKVERFLAPGLSRQDARETVRKMLAGTPAGSLPMHQINQPHPEAGTETACYDEAFRNTERRLAEAHDRVKRERHLASLQWGTLEGHPPARRLVMVRNDERLHHWGLYDLLLQRSRDFAEMNPAEAVTLAELALAVAERLDTDVYGEERVADFKTGALAALGDARRKAGDFAGARLAFSQARIHLEMGTGDLLEEAGLLGGLVNLLCDLGEYEKAAQSLERASALYRRMGDSQLDGVTVLRPVEEEEDEAGARASMPGLQRKEAG
jgi:tetratricopeptide (TPR) repeat protein